MIRNSRNFARTTSNFFDELGVKCSLYRDQAKLAPGYLVIVKVFDHGLSIARISSSRKRLRAEISYFGNFLDVKMVIVLVPKSRPFPSK